MSIRTANRLASPKAPVLVLAVIFLFGTAFLLPAGAAERISLEMGEASPEAGSDVRQGLPVELFEKTIRSAYSALEDYTANAETGIEFRLDNLVTHGEKAFDDLRIIDIATMPEARVIDVGRKTRSTEYPSGDERVQVRYQAKWRTMEGDWRSNPKAAAGVDLSVREAMALKVQEDPIFGHLRAVTTYDVTATLEDESRTYRASFYWFKSASERGWENFDLLVVDHITQGVEAALRETIPAQGTTVPASERPVTEDGWSQDLGTGSRNSLATKVSCTAGTVGANTVSPSGNDSGFHVIGRHSASTNLVFQCNCDSLCYQDCYAGTALETCQDGGVTVDACHKMVYGTDAQGAVVYGGGASCTAAFRCVQGSCLFCQCGLTVGVSISGTTVTYSGDRGNWSFTRGYSFSCPTCPIDTTVDGPKDPICGSSLTDTTTASLEMDSSTRLSSASASLSGNDLAGNSATRRSSGRVSFPLDRVETRDGESFIMDEWAVTADGAVTATSNPAFAEAVMAKGAVAAEGTSVIVQKPIHVMNERHVPEPGVAVDLSPLPRPMQGDGETVAARVEFNPAGRVDSIEILFSSAPVNEEAIEGLLHRRVSVAFVGEKTHRAAAYVVARITDQLEVVRAISALPQCCCGETFCI